MSSDESPWRNEETLRELYWDEELSQREIGKELGCSQRTVLKWMKKLGIESRLSTHEKPPSMYTDKRGREMFSLQVGDEHYTIPVHRMIMIAEHGIGYVIDKDVHHINKIPWDNRPENLTLLSPDKHIWLHRDESGQNAVWREKDVLYQMYVEEQMTMDEIADELGCDYRNIAYWINKHEIPTRARGPNR